MTGEREVANRYRNTNVDADHAAVRFAENGDSE